MIDRRALVVGIDKYANHPELKCPASDAKTIADLLSTGEGDRSTWSVTYLKPRSGKISQERLISEYDKLFDKTSLTRSTDLLFYFSGHAQYGRQGQTWLIASNGQAVSLQGLIHQLGGGLSARARSVTIILDCCFSGDIGDIRTRFDSLVATVPENTTILTSSANSQLSKELDFQNPETLEHTYRTVFSSELIGGLQGAASDIIGDVTTMSLYAHASSRVAATVRKYLDVGDEQTPLFKSNTNRPVVIRRSPPKINIDSLAQITAIFKSVDDLEHFTPSHEGVEDDDGWIDRKKDDRKPYTGSCWQIRNDRLKDFRNAGLLETFENRDFWFLSEAGVPENKNWGRLNPLGKYYWHLVDSGYLDQR